MTWEEKHSVNCIICGKLVDERDCTPQDQGGDVCPECGPHHFLFLEEFREFLATRPVGDVINLAKECIGQIVDDYEDYYQDKETLKELSRWNRVKWMVEDKE